MILPLNCMQEIFANFQKIAKSEKTNVLNKYSNVSQIFEVQKQNV